MSFQKYREVSHNRVVPNSLFVSSKHQDISIRDVNVLTALRKKPTQCRPKNTQCAISRLPRPSKWSETATKPGLFAYPIVPDEMLAHIIREEDDDDDELSSRNWITMLSHIYQFFAAGHVAIHPESLVIRCFNPSKVIWPYHGCTASFKDPSPVHRRILGLHYEQCVHANMTAHSIKKKPLGLEGWNVKLTEDFINTCRNPDIGDATAKEYCTQSCLLGLFNGLPLDPYCPNFVKHQASSTRSEETGLKKHSLHAESLFMLLQAQLEHDQSTYCRQPKPSTQGNHGQLFKLTEAEFGYTLVGKGVCASEQHKLANEYRIYKSMQSIQGQCVPVCIGVCALQVPCGRHADKYEKITHMLLLSHAGIAVENENGEEPMLPVNDDIVAMEAFRTFADINKCGVKRSDQRKKHQFWNEERDRVFFIDFEKDALRNGP